MPIRKPEGFSKLFEQVHFRKHYLKNSVVYLRILMMIIAFYVFTNHHNCTDFFVISFFAFVLFCFFTTHDADS